MHFAGRILLGLIKYNFLTESVWHYPPFAPQIAHTFQHRGGNFSPWLIRPAHMLLKHPASTRRVVKAGGCLKLAG